MDVTIGWYDTLTACDPPDAPKGNAQALPIGTPSGASAVEVRLGTLVSGGGVGRS